MATRKGVVSGPAASSGGVPGRMPMSSGPSSGHGPAGPQQPTPEQLAHIRRVIHMKSIARLFALTGDRDNLYAMLQTFDVNDRDAVFAPLVLYAVTLGSPRLLADLIEARADLFVLIPSARRKLSLLHVAAMLGFPGIFKQLVEAGGERMRRGAASAECLNSNSSAVSNAGAASESGAGAGAGAGDAPASGAGSSAAPPMDTVRPSDPLVYIACAAGQPELLKYLVEELGADPAVAAPDCRSRWPTVEQYGLDAPLVVAGQQPDGGPPPARIGQHFADALHAACVGRRALCLEAGLLCDAVMPPHMEAALMQGGIHVSFAGDWPRGTHPASAAEAAESGMRTTPADSRGVLSLLLDRYGIGGLTPARYGTSAGSDVSSGSSSAVVRAKSGSGSAGAEVGAGVGAARDMRSPLPPAAWHAYAALAAQYGNADALAVLLERGLLDTPLPGAVTGAVSLPASPAKGESPPVLAVFAPSSSPAAVAGGVGTEADGSTEALLASAASDAASAAAFESSPEEISAAKSSLLYAATAAVFRGRGTIQQWLQIVVAKICFQGSLSLKLLLSVPAAAMVTKLVASLPHDIARCAALIVERAAWLHASADASASASASAGRAPAAAAAAAAAFVHAPQLSPLYPRLWVGAVRETIGPATTAIASKRLEVMDAMVKDAAKRGPPRGPDGQPVRGPDGMPLEAEDSFSVLVNAVIASAERATNRFARALQAAHDAADAEQSTAGAAGKGVAAGAAREGAAALEALLDVGDDAVEATAASLGAPASSSDGAGFDSGSGSGSVPAAPADGAFLRLLAPGYEMNQDRFTALCASMCAPRVAPTARRTALWRAHVESTPPVEVLAAEVAPTASEGIAAGRAGTAGDTAAADADSLLSGPAGAASYPALVRPLLHAIRPDALSLSLPTQIDPVPGPVPVSGGPASAAAVALARSDSNSSTGSTGSLRSASSKGKGAAALRDVLASFGLGTEAVDAAETARSNALLSRRAMLRELQVTSGALAWYRARPHVLSHAAALWTVSEDVVTPQLWLQAPARLSGICRAAAARGAAAALAAPTLGYAGSGSGSGAGSASAAASGPRFGLSSTSLRSPSFGVGLLRQTSSSGSHTAAAIVAASLSRASSTGSTGSAGDAGEAELELELDEDNALEALAAAAIPDGSSDALAASTTALSDSAAGAGTGGVGTAAALATSGAGKPGGSMDSLFLAVLVAMLAAAAYIIAAWATQRI